MKNINITEITMENLENVNGGAILPSGYNDMIAQKENAIQGVDASW